MATTARPGWLYGSGCCGLWTPGDGCPQHTGRPAMGLAARDAQTAERTSGYAKCPRCAKPGTSDAHVMWCDWER
jgi:hypothetical protein